MIERLDLGDKWMSSDGQVRELRDLPSDHLIAIGGYLRWFAPTLMAMDAAAGYTDPRSYLVTRSLWSAIEANLMGRGALGLHCSLLDLLRAEGPVPWEAEFDASTGDPVALRGDSAQQTSA